MNLTSALLKQIIVESDFDTWGNLRENYVSSEYKKFYKLIDKHINDYNALPTFEDLKLSVREGKLIEQIHAIDALEVDVEASIILEYLKNEYTQIEILDELNKFVDDTVAIARAEENVEAIQQIVLDIGERVDLKDPEEDLKTLPLFDTEKDLKKYLPLGLNDAYDYQVKFSPRDLVLVGGRRGAGKSITCCNIAHNVYKNGKSSLYFTIEMDARSILQRMCALGAEVPVGRLATRNLQAHEWDRVTKWWSERFEGGVDLLPFYYEDRDFDKFHSKLTTLPLNKDRQLDVVYDPMLSLSRIRQELESKMSQREYGVIVVDYLNQVKRSNAPSRAGQYDWTEQIEVSKTLKSIAQEYEVPVFSPYQTDSTGEARFAKGILDAADAAFTLETWSPEDECITFNCTKMRSAKMEGFTSTMNWETLQIGPGDAQNPKDKEEVKDSLSTGESAYDAV